MAREKRKTVRDYILSGGLKGRKFTDSDGRYYRFTEKFFPGGREDSPHIFCDLHYLDGTLRTNAQLGNLLDNLEALSPEETFSQIRALAHNAHHAG